MAAAKSERIPDLAVEFSMCVFGIRRATVALAAFVAFLACLIYLADTGQGWRLFALGHSIPLGDKIGHFVLFGVLSFLVNHLFRAGEIRLGAISVLKGSALVAAIVTLEECSQLLFRHRSFDLGDLAADFAGIWFCGMLARRYLASKRPDAISRVGIPTRNQPVGDPKKANPRDGF